MIRQSQQQGQKQLLKLSPQQIQLLNFLQLNTLELEQKIKDELEENPALEAEAPAVDTDPTLPEAEAPGSDGEPESDSETEEYDRFDLLEQYHQDDDLPEYKTTSDLRNTEETSFSPTLVQGVDFREHLKEQLIMMPLSDRERLLASYLVDSLDDDGYLRLDLDDVADNLSFAHGIFVETADLEAVLEIVQDLEPIGVGARDLRECLLLQLEAKQHNVACIDLAYTIVKKHLNDLANRNYDKLINVLGVTTEEMKCATSLIARLNPRPVGSNTAELVKNQNIIPEFIVEKLDDGQMQVFLANGNSASLRISGDMVQMLESMQRDKSGKRDKAALQYLRSKVDSAIWFVEMVRQREQSMLKSMQAIVTLQRDYFRTGDEKNLRPMILKDVAEQTGLDISTISRVTSMKYALAPFGIVHLKELFNGGLAKTDGEMVTNKEISDIISELIGLEDKQNPITDQEMADKLLEKGYHVARRTVAKYRDAMNIPVAKMRKAL